MFWSWSRRSREALQKEVEKAYETDARSHSSRTRAWFQRRSETRRRTGAAGRRRQRRTAKAPGLKGLRAHEENHWDLESCKVLRSSETWVETASECNRALMKLTTGEAREVVGGSSGRRWLPGMEETSDEVRASDTGHSLCGVQRDGPHPKRTRRFGWLKS